MGIIVNNARTITTIRTILSRNLAGIEFMSAGPFMSLDGGFTWMPLGPVASILAGSHSGVSVFAPIAIPAGAVLAMRVDFGNSAGFSGNISVTLS